MKRILALILVIALTAVAACQQQPVGVAIPNESLIAPGNETGGPTGAVVAQPEAKPYTITKTEGDLVEFHSVAVDPEGGPITYTFSGPLDKNGTWQTGYGDAGNYTVTVTAYNKAGLATAEQVLVVIERANRPPVLNCPPTINVKEGETVMIDCTATDAENETVVLSYDGWMASRSYATLFGDAGTHEVTVTADDGHTKPVKQTVKVIVQKVNRPPVFPADFPSKIVGAEGDVVTINTGGVYDPDGLPLTFTFSAPFNEKGVWKTKIGDVGQYLVDVVASDGVTSVKQTVTVVITMQITPPVLKRISDITVSEGDTITLPLIATDRGNNKLTFTVSGWMTSSEYTTTYGDAGSYTVKVTVSNGQLTDSQVVHITVLKKNRPPVFKVPA
jgi:hypothetical protein